MQDQGHMRQFGGALGATYLITQMSFWLILW